MNKERNSDIWRTLGQGYLRSAIILCKAFPERTDKDRIALINPILFNTKHGIEVFLKLILLHFDQTNDKLHDPSRCLLVGLRNALEFLKSCWLSHYTNIPLFSDCCFLVANTAL